MLKSDSENPVDVLGTTAELASGASSTNQDLFLELIKVERALENLGVMLSRNNVGSPVHEMRCVLFEIVVSLGYGKKYTQYSINRLSALGVLQPRDLEWAKEKYGIQGVTNE
jgi:hypothetical protein